MKLNDFIKEGRSADPKVVAKFADVRPQDRSYYIMKWAEKKGMDSDDAMELAGYVRDGYIGAGAWNWRYVGLDEEKQRLDPKCWKGYKKQGTKMKGGVRVNNCVKEAKQALARHVKEGVPLPDSLFRYQSDAYFDTFKYAKQLREAGILQELDWESEEMLNTDIGESVVLENGETVWLDVPYLDESDDFVYTEASDQGSTEGEAMVAKMLAKALGDENRWSEMTPHELYAELESEKPEVADVIKLTAKMLYDVRLAENTKEPWFAITEKVETTTIKLMKEMKGKDIYPNVDLYSASLYYMLKIPVDLNTPIFAISRVVGWAAHIIEEKFAEAAPKPALYRPKATYVGKYCGPEGCKYERLDLRK